MRLLRTLPSDVDENKLMNNIFSIELPEEFHSLLALIREDHERKRTTLAHKLTAPERPNLLDVVRDEYVAPNAFVTPNRTSLQPRHIDDDNDNDDNDNDDDGDGDDDDDANDTSSGRKQRARRKLNL